MQLAQQAENTVRFIVATYVLLGWRIFVLQCLFFIYLVRFYHQLFFVLAADSKTRQPVIAWLMVRIFPATLFRHFRRVSVFFFFYWFVLPKCGPVGVILHDVLGASNYFIALNWTIGLTWIGLREIVLAGAKVCAYCTLGSALFWWWVLESAVRSIVLHATPSRFLNAFAHMANTST